MTTQNVAPKPAPENTERSVERVKELRAQIDRNPLAFAIQAERLEREHTKLVEALRVYLDLCPRMSDDDPIAPALADACQNTSALLRELGESE